MTTGDVTMAEAGNPSSFRMARDTTHQRGRGSHLIPAREEGCDEANPADGGRSRGGGGGGASEREDVDEIIVAARREH